LRKDQVLELCLAVLLGSCAVTGTGFSEAKGGRGSSENQVGPEAGAGSPTIPRDEVSIASPASSSIRALKIKERMAPVPDWACLDEGNFLILHSTRVQPERIREVVGRLQALLKVLAGEYPTERVKDALFVLRICKDQTQYSQYGGPGNSTGYWNPMEEEMVSFIDESAAKRSIRSTASLLVHAYFSQALDSAAPHDWFTVGLSSFYSGCVLNRSGTLVPRRNADFASDITKAEEGGTTAPLDQFLRYGHAQFTGQQILQNYAQAWSFHWFLKMQESPEWAGLLPSYYAALRSGLRETPARGDGTAYTGHLSPEDGERIRESAWKVVFGGFDESKWRRLERAWLDFK
jgi:hypothetical protein